MRYVSAVALVALASLAIAAYAGDKLPKSCGDRQVLMEQGDPKVFIQDVPGPGIVPKTCAIMEKENFKTIVGIALLSEDIAVEKKTIKFEGSTYQWKALVYDGTDTQPRIAARELLKDGQVATRLEELKLNLAKKIPLAVWGGHWFPPKNQGACFEFGYGRIGKNAKVEVVGTTADGRTIKHVTQDGVASYFAVETTHKIKKPYSFTVTLSPISDCTATKERWASVAELKACGTLEADVVSMKMIGSEQYTDGDTIVSTRTYLVMGEHETTEIQSTTYPYYE